MGSRPLRGARRHRVLYGQEGHSDRTIADFSEACADQNERDHAAPAGSVDNVTSTRGRCVVTCSSRHPSIIDFRPFSRRSIALADIERQRVREYSAIKEYGGWGVQGWSRKKVVYNVSGHQGVELPLREGRAVMLGSRRPRELTDAIERQRWV